MEAGSGAHHWARELIALGHDARILDPRLVAPYLAAQDVRTPSRLAEMLPRWNEQLPQVVQDTVSRTVRELEIAHREGATFPIERDTNAAYFSSRVTIDEGSERKAHASSPDGRGPRNVDFRDATPIDRNGRCSARWTILCSSPGAACMTSDKPVVRLNYHSDSKYDFGGGWGSTGTEIFIPLSPKHLMYTKIGSSPPARGTVLSFDQTDAFGRMILENAHRMSSRFLRIQQWNGSGRGWLTRRHFTKSAISGSVGTRNRAPSSASITRKRLRNRNVSAGLPNKRSCETLGDQVPSGVLNG